MTQIPKMKPKIYNKNSGPRPKTRSVNESDDLGQQKTRLESTGKKKRSDSAQHPTSQLCFSLRPQTRRRLIDTPALTLNETHKVTSSRFHAVPSTEVSEATEIPGRQRKMESRVQNEKAWCECTCYVWEDKCSIPMQSDVVMVSSPTTRYKALAPSRPHTPDNTSTSPSPSLSKSRFMYMKIIGQWHWQWESTFMLLSMFMTM